MQGKIFPKLETTCSAIFYLFTQEFGSRRWMSIERKSIWTVRVINERYIYCSSLK